MPDPAVLVYYAAVCACLAAASPRLGPMPWRLVAGGAVGLVAAALLPHLRALTGV